MALFQPSLSTQPQPAQTGVAPNTGAIAAVEQVGTTMGKIAFELGEDQAQEAAGKSLAALQKELQQISQAREMGGDRFALQTRSRMKLNQFKANYPGLEKQADFVYGGVFGTGAGSAGAAGGSGGSGGVFSASPLEAAQEKAQAQVMELSQTLNISPEAAQERIVLKAQSEAAAQRATIDKYNEGQVEKSTSQSFEYDMNDRSVGLLDTIHKELQTSGSIGAVQRAQFEHRINTEAMAMRSKLRKEVYGDDGRLLISQEEFTRRMNAINTWSADQRAIIDGGATKTVQAELLENMTNEQAIRFTQLFPQVVGATTSGGQQAGNTILELMVNPDPLRAEWEKSADPRVKIYMDSNLLGQGMTTGAAKVLSPEEAKLNLYEATSLATAFATPKGPSLAAQLWDGANPNSKACAYDMGRQAPIPTLNAMNKPAMISAYRQQPQKYKAAYDGAVEGVQASFYSNFVMENGRFPSKVEVEVRTGLGGGKSLAIHTDSGQGGSYFDSNTKLIQDFYNMLVRNPTYLRQQGEEIGMPDITPEQYMTAVLSYNGSIDASIKKTAELGRRADTQTEFWVPKFIRDMFGEKDAGTNPNGATAGESGTGN